MEVEDEFISAACNCTYNCLELDSTSLIFGANQALAIYNILDARVVSTLVSHQSRINCIRILKLSNGNSILSSDSNGQLVLWKRGMTKNYKPEIIRQGDNAFSITVCDGIKLSDQEILIGFVTSLSRVLVFQVLLSNEEEMPSKQVLVHEMDLKQSIALDLVFHVLESDGTVLMALGMDSGSVNLFGYNKETPALYNICTLKKHEDWVRCIAFYSSGQTTFMATGGEDCYIAIWRFVHSSGDSPVDGFEFQVQEFQNYKILFDSMIMGHEGWINSLAWSPFGELVSCSSDQSIIIWQNSCDIWTEKVRFGTVGGQTPGGFGAKLSEDTLAVCGFQGSIQIWQREENDWNMKPSVTGHFNSVTDLDYHKDGNFLVTTSLDQTSRIFAPWGSQRWHEIARPQIHGHDIFAAKFCQDYLVSGAEEKILRAFQPTEVFVKSLEETSQISVHFDQVSPSATLPALGLSNQTGSDTNGTLDNDNLSVETRLDEDFLRSNTLWPEVSKLFGHVYEITCIATCKNRPLIASASNASKPQFSGIILWCSKTWTNLGDFKFHKLNVNDMEFNEAGDLLLSASRDRTWALWKVIECTQTSKFTMELMDSGGGHTRALMVGSWVPRMNVFATGGRDKKLIVWKPPDEGKVANFEPFTSSIFKHPVSAISVNEDCILAAGLESGCLFLFQLSFDCNIKGEERLKLLLKLENGSAHHGNLNRLKFNPKNKNQLASVGSDHLLKIYRLSNQREIKS